MKISSFHKLIAGEATIFNGIIYYSLWQALEWFSEHANAFISRVLMENQSLIYSIRYVVYQVLIDNNTFSNAYKVKQEERVISKIF